MEASVEPPGEPCAGGSCGPVPDEDLHCSCSGVGCCTRALPSVASAANTRDSVTGGDQAFFDSRDMLFVGQETTQNDSQNQDRNEVCGFSDPDFDSVGVARGNVEVRNRNTSEDDDPDPGTPAGPRPRR